MQTAGSDVDSKSSRRGRCVVLTLLSLFWLLSLGQSSARASTISKIRPSSSSEKMSAEDDMPNDSNSDDAGSRHNSKDNGSAQDHDADAKESQEPSSNEGDSDASNETAKQESAESQNDDDGSTEKSTDDTANDQSGDDGQNDLLTELQPKLEQNLNLYNDSEHYKTLTSTSVVTGSVHDFDVTVRRDSILAEDLQGSQRAESTVVSIHRDLSEQFGIGGGLGSVKTLTRSDIAGSFRAHADIHGLSLEANVAHDPLLNNAVEIRSHVRQTDFGFTASAELFKHLSSNVEFHHKLYSDGNHSNEMSFGPQYTFDIASGKLALGYGVSYMAFARETTAGYWAPQYFLSHDLSATWSFDWGTTYGLIAVSAGRATGRASAKESPAGPSSGYGYGATAAIGMRPTKGTILEYYWNGTTSAQWNSTTMGLKLSYGN